MSRLLGAGALLALWAVACDRDVHESLLSEPIGGQTQLRAPTTRGLPSAALEAIVQAGCTRAERCDEIGPGREHASRDECTRSIHAAWVGELNALACPRGVDEGGLAACLRALNQSNCNDVLDALERWTACSARDICDVPPQPPPVPLAQDLAVPG